MMRRLLPILSCLMTSLAAPAFAQPDVGLDLEVSSTGRGVDRPDRVQGTMTIAGWSAEGGERCVYLPYNDENYRANLVATQFLKVAAPLEDNASQRRGITKIAAGAGTQITELKPYLYAVRGEGPLALNFTTTETERKLFTVRDAFFDSYHPLLLKTCPKTDADEKALHYQAANLASWKLKAPEGWGQVSAFDAPKTDATATAFRSERFSFALIRDYRHETFEKNGLVVDVHFRTPEFQELIGTMKTALESHMKWFGPYPFPKLVVVESSSLQPADMPGLVAINKPQQAAFATLQKDILNWAHWATVNLFAWQWYGAAIKTPNEDDSWLPKGIVDFATYEALKYNQNRYDLFNGFKFDNLGLTLNYLEAQNLAAALLERYSPDNQLTDAEFRTVQSAWQQHPYLYIKAAIALRHLNSLAGEDRMTRFLRQFTQRKLFDDITPGAFHGEFSQLPSPFSPVKRQELQGALTEWWTKQGWPDFALGKVASKEISEGRYLHKVTVRQLSDFNLPTMVEVRDERGIRYAAPVYPTFGSKDTTIEMVTNAPLKTVVIDPAEDLFDEDRLNNTNRFPSINFWPGSATAIRDDGYTLFWLPYPFRRAGQNLSLGLFGAVFRYIDRVLLLRVEKEIASGAIGYSVLWDTRIPRFNMTLELTASQNYDHFRTLGASLMRDPVVVRGVHVSGALTLRDKRIEGAASSAHQTVSIQPMFETKRKQGLCQFNAQGEFETTLGKTNDISYQRSKGLGMVGCEVFKSLTVVARGFRGKVRYRGYLPANAFFDPEDISEARLRIDQKGLAKSTDLLSHAYDLLFPMILPIPGNTMILDRQLRGRLFLDNGENYSARANYRSAGVGLLLPLGGEFTGSGSLAITKLNFFTILYSKVKGKVSRQPRFLFDLTGEF